MISPDRPQRSGTALLLGVALAAVLSLLTLAAGFDHDETLQLGYLEGAPPPGHESVSPLDLWFFADGSTAEHAAIRRQVARGDLPWCTPVAQPRDRMRFLRPLSSATLWLDHTLFGLAPAGYHLHTSIWFVGVVALVAALFARTLGPAGGAPSRLPLLALVVFVLSATHAEAMARPATRHLLIAGAAGLAALLCHLRWREDGWRPGRWACLALLGLALLSSENALQAIAYLVAFELAGASGPWRRRLGALAPVAALVLVYALGYAALGYGARGGGYVDPFRQPLELAGLVPLRLADLALEELLVPTAWRSGTHSPWQLARIGAGPAARLALGAAALAAAALAARRAGRSRTPALRWLTLGAALSLLPVAAGQPGPRLLFLPGIGLAALVAAGVHGAWTAGRDPSRRGTARWALLSLGLALAVLRLVASPVALLRQIGTHRRITNAIVERWLPPGPAVPQLDGLTAPPAPEAIVLVAPSTSAPAGYLPGLRHVLDGERPRRRDAARPWWFLSNNTVDFAHRMVRTGPSSFELAIDRPQRAAPLTRTLWIGCAEPPREPVELQSLRITVLDADRTGGILRIRVEHARSLDDPALWLVSWRDGALRRIPPPPVGALVALD